MASPIVEAYQTVSNLTQTQDGVNLQLTNPDIQGYAIRLSSFIAHLCVAVLLAYSTKNKRYFYLPLLSQSALIIFAIWLCRKRNQLSIFDVEFAITQTRSPVSIYALLFVIPRLFFQRSAIERKDPTSKSHDGASFVHRMFNSESINWTLIGHRAWGLLYALCCLSINLVRRLDKAGYTNFTSDGLSADPTTLPNLISGERPDIKVLLGLVICSVLIYECVLHRHGGERREIMHQLAGKRRKSLNAWPLSKRVRWGFSATWFVVTKLHPWLPFSYASVMFLNWSRDMRIWEIEDDFEWTYGQLFAMSQLFIILYPCLKLCYRRRREITPLPRRLILDAIWLISGNGQPWTDPVECDLILRDLWNTFPPDETPEEIGLPTATVDASSGVVNPLPNGTSDRSARARRRRRGNRVDMGSRSEHVADPLAEEDIGEQSISRNRFIIHEVRANPT